MPSMSRTGLILALLATPALAHPDESAHQHAANDPGQFLGGHGEPLTVALLILVAVIGVALAVRLVRARSRAE